MPVIFGLTTITFWQAFGLFVLSRLLFGHIGRKSHRGGFPFRKSPFDKMRKKWHQMSPEQQEQWRQKMHYWKEEHRSHFGHQSPFCPPDKENHKTSNPEDNDQEGDK